MDVMFSTGLTNELSGTDTDNTWTIQLICPQEEMDATFLNEKSIVYTIENETLQSSVSLLHFNHFSAINISIIYSVLINMIVYLMIVICLKYCLGFGYRKTHS